MTSTVTAHAAIEPIRSALRGLKSATAEIGSEPPTWDRILTIRQHEGALDPTRPIVIGDRGTGKSFWTGALQDAGQRKRLASVYPRLSLDRLHVSLGFGGGEFSSEHPSQSELNSLLTAGFDPEVIWRTAALSLAPASLRPSAMPSGLWKDKVEWVARDPAHQRRAFQEIETTLQAKNERYLITFDALDTLSSRWSDIGKLVRGLLVLGLFLRSSRNIKIKLFLRPDMADDPELWAVGDSSKLRHDEVMLTWTRTDLYALLIQYLANHDETREIMNEYCVDIANQAITRGLERCEVPSEFITSEIAQQALLGKLQEISWAEAQQKVELIPGFRIT